MLPAQVPDPKRRVLPIKHLQTLTEVFHRGTMCKGNAMIRVTEDCLKLRRLAENVVHYHEVCEPVMLREAIQELAEVL
jgi:hypothetical protein